MAGPVADKEFERLIADPTFLSLDRDSQDAFVDELRQRRSKLVPPSENILQRAVKASRAGGFPITPLGAIPSSRQELGDIGRLIGTEAQTSALIPGPTQPVMQLLGRAAGKPQTQFGEALGTAKTAAEIAPLGFGAVSIGRRIADAAKRPDKLVGAVQEIQKGFFPFVQKAQAKFKGAVRESTRRSFKSGKFNIPNEEIGAITETTTNLTPKGTRAVEELRSVTGRNKNVLDVRRAVTKLRQSVKPTDVSEEARATREAIKKMKGSLSKRLDGLEDANREYAIFSDDKAILERFRPEKAGRSISGTERGTRILRKIKGQEPGVKAALRRFEADTGIKFVDEAIKIQSATERATVIKKALVGTAITAAAWGAIGRPILNMVETVSDSGGE